MLRRNSDIQKVFTMFADENNMLQSESIIKAIRCAGYLADDSFIADNISEAQIDFVQFKKLIENVDASEPTRETIEASFKKFDPKETGYIEANELKRILGEGENALTPDEIQDIMLEYFIPNDEGFVCYNLLVQSLFESCE